MFNKVTNKVEESIHVAFDESFVLQGLDSSGEEFTFQCEDTPGSPTHTSNHVESDSEEEGHTPKLVPTSVSDEHATIQGEEEEESPSEDRNMSPVQTQEVQATLVDRPTPVTPRA